MSTCMFDMKLTAIVQIYVNHWSYLLLYMYIGLCRNVCCGCVLVLTQVEYLGP